MRVAFIGLGNMGGPMATNLARSGLELSIFDLDRSKAQSVLDDSSRRGEANVTAAKSVTEAVKNADVVLTSLPNPKAIETVALTGLLDSMSRGSTWIDLSTNNLECERIVRTAATERGVNFLDAPVTGGIEGAAAATLMIMVGGDADTFQKVKPVLERLGKTVLHLGPHGAGYVAKISQVVLCYLNSVALSEALMLGVKGGVDAGLMLKIIQGSTGASYVADRYGPEILNGSYDPGFALGLAHKDMVLTLQLANAVGATLPMCKDVESIYREAVEKYGANVNHLMAVKLLEEQNSTLLRS